MKGEWILIASIEVKEILLLLTVLSQACSCGGNPGPGI